MPNLRTAMAATFPATRIPADSGAAAAMCPAQRKAMALWPRLDRRALIRAGCSPARIARYVARRTRVPESAIQHLLEQAEAAAD